MFAHTSGRCLIIALLAISLAACNEDDKKPATQVAAKVNQEEISVHQINNLLARAGNVPAERAKEASRQILDKLIDQEVMVQKAIEKKLDRDPRVMQTIEANRRDVLSRAYLDQVAAAVAKPTAEEIHDYYGKHPELFAQRRVYQFQELAIEAANPEVVGRVQKKLPTFRSMAEIAGWLNAEKIRFAANTTTKAAEQLPLELLPRIHQMKDGQIGLIPARDSIVVVQLVASRSMPTEEKTATPFIEQYLGNQRRIEAAEKELKSLRTQAKIEYMGDFTVAAQEKAKADAIANAERKAKDDELAQADAKSKAAAKIAADEQAMADAKARAESRAKLAETAEKAPATARVSTGAPAPAVIDKGLSGLK